MASFDTPFTPAAVTTAAGVQLRVDTAMQLLARAGHSDDLHQLEPGSQDWLQAMIDGLCTLSSRDPLTGLFNRRQFEASLDSEIDRVARSGESAMLLLIDIDHFKQVNDTHGHGAGDRVIHHIGRALLECMRPMDVVARLGGEEFGAVLPNCAPSSGEAVADRVRQAIARRPIEIAPRQSIHVTVSVGAAFAPQWVRTSARMWLERADRQLYQAKAAGRNCVRLDPPPRSEVSNEERELLFSTLSSFMPDSLDPAR